MLSKLQYRFFPCPFLSYVAGVATLLIIYGTAERVYEANAGIPEGKELEAFTDAARFVAALLDERLVLAMRRGFRGGREFIAPSELTPSRRRSLEWTASWRGTYDWAVPT